MQFWVIGIQEFEKLKKRLKNNNLALILQSTTFLQECSGRICRNDEIDIKGLGEGLGLVLFLRFR